jgi:hypothetical protein
MNVMRKIQPLYLDVITNTKDAQNGQPTRPQEVWRLRRYIPNFV